MFLFSADSGARPVPSELVLWCVVVFTKERSAWSSRTKMLNQSDWIISNCTSSLLHRELLLVPIGCSTLARLAAVHPSSAQPPPSPSLGPRSSATRSRKGLVFTKNADFSNRFFLRKFWDCSGAKVCKYCRAWKMLSNAYFVAKFRFDTAENEPAKNLQNFRKMHFRKMHF